MFNFMIFFSNRFILNQKLQIPTLPYFGACGRVTFVQGPYKPLTDFIKEPLCTIHSQADPLMYLLTRFGCKTKYNTILEQK